jgi:tripartite-type tricarboxylate transporter receptor subunit TctC
MYKRILFVVLAISVCFTFLPYVTFGDEPYYEGKTIRLIVGTSPGGGMDLYARTIARHLSKQIQGNPTIIVENMTGAGGLISANHLYNVAKPDGLTIGHFSGGLFFTHVLGQPGGKFDPRKFEIIGSPAPVTNLCVLTKMSGVNNIEKWMASKRALKIGGVGPGNVTTDTTPRILKAALGLPIQHLSGYKGTADIRVAVDSGELDGVFVGYETVTGQWAKAVERGDVFVVLQAQPKPMAGLENIPLAIDFAKTEEARQLIERGIHTSLILQRPFLMPPNTPKERIEIIRNAFMETMKNMDFLEEAKKARLTIDPIPAAEVEKALASILTLAPDLVAKFKDILLQY